MSFYLRRNKDYYYYYYYLLLIKRIIIIYNDNLFINIFEANYYLQVKSKKEL